MLEKEKATPENTIILFVCPRKFCISIVSSFSWNLQWSQEKTKTMLMQNLGGQTKSKMAFSGMANNIFGILILTDHHERKQESLSDELFINAIIFCHATLGLQVSLLVLPSRTTYPTFFHANPFY